MTTAIEAKSLVKRYRVRVRGLIRRKYDVIEALRKLSFTVRYGEVYGLLGPNGAGKTTAVKIVSTLLLPDEGDAIVAGYSSIRQPYKVRERIGVMLSVERGFFWKLTGIENLRYFGMLYGLSGDTLKRRIEEVSRLVGLREVGADKRRFEDMSLGMKARLGLARALLKNPEVLILDEPTLGLDPPSARRIRRLIRELAGEGKAVLLTTHNMFEAETVCDRVGIIVKGRIVAEGTPRELKRIVKGKSGVYAGLKGSREAVDEIVRRLREEMGLSAGVTGESDGLYRVRIVADVEGIDRLTAWMLDNSWRLGVRIVEWRVEEPTLEDVFIEVAGGDSEGG